MLDVIQFELTRFLTFFISKKKQCEIVLILNLFQLNLIMISL